MKFISALCFLFFVCFQLSGQEANPTYFLRGKPDVLTISNKFLLVKLEEGNSSTKENFEKEHLQNRGLTYRYLKPINAFRIETSKVESAEFSKMIADFTQLPEVRHVYPMVEKGAATALVNNVLVLQAKAGQQLQLEQLARRFGVVKERIDLGAGILLTTVELNRGLDIFEVSRKIYASGLTEIAEPDFIIEASSGSFTPNDPLFIQQWFLNNQDDIDIDAPEAWGVTTGSSSTVVAVIDGHGFQLDHPELVGKVVTPYDAANDNDNPMPENSSAHHGTPCAGLVGASTNNSTGVASVGNAIMVLPICIGYDVTASGFHTNSVIVARAASKVIGTPSCAVTSNSWGTTSASIGATYEISFNSMHTNGHSGLGIVNLTAYGNSSLLDPVVFPANFPSSFTVTASNEFDRLASFSNGGVNAKISAPGEGGIYTISKFGFSPNGYNNFGGTSAATPIVAGVAGLVSSILPTATATQIEEILAKSADKTTPPWYSYNTTAGYPYGRWSPVFGYGRVNAYNAVLMAKSCVPAVGVSCSGSNYINSFSVNTLSNTGSGCNGLANNFIFYGTREYTTHLVPGATYPFNITAGGSVGQVYGIWLDYNADGDFADAGEFIYSSSATSFNGSGSIVIPAAIASMGKKHLRVRCKSASGAFAATDWCSSISYGETEDYIVTINKQQLMRTATVSTCSDNFYDTGGFTGNYSNDQSFVLTVVPSTGNRVSVTFFSYDTELNFDYLKIYSGTGTSGPLLATLTGLSDPLLTYTYTSAAANGQLTFQFYSDATAGGKGWSAVLNCVPLLFSSGQISNNNQTLCNPANPSSIGFLVSPTSGTTRQWYFKDGIIAAPDSMDPTIGWTLISSATGTTYDPPAGLTQSRTYACRVIKTPYSKWATDVRQIIVLPVFDPGTLSYGNQSFITSGDPAAVNLATPPSGGEGSNGYQWYSKAGIQAAPTGTTIPVGWVAISGATSASYDPGVQTASISYAVRVDPNGTPDCSVARWASGVRQITVTPSVTFTPGVLSAGNETICNAGDPATISFSNAATQLSIFQWYYQNGIIAAPSSAAATTGWTIITGAISSSYNPATGLTASRTYACRVTNGVNNQWASGVRQVNVLPVFNAGTITGGDESFCTSGNPAAITLSTNPAGSGAYQWTWYYRETATGACPSGSTVPAGWNTNTSATISGTSLTGSGISFDPSSAGAVGAGRTFAVLITPIANGGIPACGAPAWSNNCRKTVVNFCTGFTPGVLTAGNQTLCNPGDPANITFSTAATTGSTYQWYFQNGIIAAPLATAATTGWTLITGATAATYDAPAGLTAGRTYARRVINGANNQWSLGVLQITVLPVFSPGTIIAGDQVFCGSGNPNNITLSTNPAGSGAYQWRWYFRETATGVCPTGSAVGAEWLTNTTSPNITGTTTTGAGISFDPASAGALGAGRTFAVLITPLANGSIPACGTAQWAASCRKTTVNSCRLGEDGQEIVEQALESEPPFLGQSFPNPTLGSFKVPYFLPASYRSGRIILYDITGKQLEVVQCVADENKTVEFNVSHLANGTYYYTLETGSLKVGTGKMILMK